MMATKPGKSNPKAAFVKLTPSMTREQKVKILIDVLNRCGLKVKPSASKCHGKGSA